MKRLVSGPALALIAGGPVSCGETAETPAGPVEAVPGLTVENARLVLPPVAGNPAAIYADFDYEGDRATTLRAVAVEGAESAQLHETVEHAGNQIMGEAGPLLVSPGETLSFEPGGKHIMVFGLPETVAAGDTVEVTVTVVGGDKMSFPAQVVAAGDSR